MHMISANAKDLMLTKNKCVVMQMTSNRIPWHTRKKKHIDSIFIKFAFLNELFRIKNMIHQTRVLIFESFQQPISW